MRKIIRHEFVTVNIPANSTLTRFNMPDLPNLRNVHLLGVQVYTIDEISVDIISRNAVCSHSVVLHQSYITMVNYGGKEFLKQIPAITFNTINQALSTIGGTNWNEMDIKSFIGQKVNYPKSFIEFTSPPALITDTAYVFSVYYSLPIEEEKKESGYSFNSKG